MVDVREIASRIDHTILKAEATLAQVDKVVAEARQHQFASVCINPIYVPHVHHALKGSGVKTCTVIGFPLGANTAGIKAAEAAAAIEHGADEIDIVAYLPNLLNNDAAAARAELEEIVYAARQARQDVIIKVIVESSLLMDGISDNLAEQRIETACKAVREAGCDFIKTSTGFHATGGATVAAVTFMKRHAGGLKVKASGGIRNRDDAVRMIELGADRLGCSAGVAIVTGATSSAKY
ncbi:MAG: deoxyribose-phosphate aldolase [Planctomycetes bacterium]|nr:deoxyribose-phosphate aldolase [Planctomycetota bacterium]